MDQLFPNSPKTVQFPPRFPNYIDPPSRGPAMNTVGITFCSVSLIFVVLRVYTRWFITKRVYVEDWLSVLAWLLSCFFVFLNWWSTKWGVGRHWYDILPEQLWLTQPFPANYISGTIYWTTMLLIKLIILRLLLRLTPNRTYQYSVYASTIFIFSSSVSSGLASTFPCVNPLSASWKLEHRLGPDIKCINYDAVLKIMAIFNLLGDVIILALPINTIITSHMPRRKKYHVLVIFLLGGIASFLAIVRVVVTFETQRPENLGDYNWASAKLLALASVEINIGVVCCCLPAVKPAFARWWPNVFGAYGDTPSSGSRAMGSGTKESNGFIGFRGRQRKWWTQGAEKKDLDDTEAESEVTVVGKEEGLGEGSISNQRV